MGWQERLKNQVKGAGWNVTAFQAKLAEFEVRAPTSYGSVWAYLNDPEAKAPPMKFFQIAAEVLGVRAAWLAFDDGKSTEEEERRRRWEEEEAARRDIGELESDAILPSGSILSPRDNADRHALFGALRALGPSREGWDRLQRAIVEPLTTLELPAGEGPAFDDYVHDVAVAIRRYARATKEGTTDG